MAKHTFTLERPSFDRRRYYQYRCSCGFATIPHPYVGKAHQSATTHLAWVRDEQLKAALLAAGERGETLSVSQWRAEHPISDPDPSV